MRARVRSRGRRRIRGRRRRCIRGRGKVGRRRRRIGSRRVRSRRSIGSRCVRSRRSVRRRRSRHKVGSLEGRADRVRVPTHVVCRECGGVGEGKRGRSEHPGDRSHGERLADVLQQRSFRGCARRNKPSDVGGCLCPGGVDASNRAVSFGHDSGSVSRRPGCCPTATRRRRRRPQPPLTRGSVDSIFGLAFLAEMDRTRPDCIRHLTTRRCLEPITGRLRPSQLIVFAGHMCIYRPRQHLGMQV